MHPELSDNETKDIFLPDLRNEIPEHDFGVIGWIVIIYFLELCIEGIPNHIVLIFRQNASAGEGDVIEYRIRIMASLLFM